MCYLCVAAAAATAPVAAIVGAVPSPAAASGTSPAFIVAAFVKPVLFSVFGLKFYNYGVFVALACFLAFLVFGNELPRARIQLDEMNCFFIFLAGFAVGSKGHLALSAIAGGSPLDWNTFINFIDLRTGHSFIGSIIGCVVFLLIYVRWHRVRMLRFLDVLLPCCLLGHAIGKIGCFMSGDGCYGPDADPAVVPWAMSFPNGQIPTRVPVHPTPIYEGFSSLMVMLIVRAVFPFPGPPREDGKDEDEAVAKMPRSGRRTALLLVLYGIERVVLEQYRRNPPIDLFGGLSEYQALAVALFLLGALLEVGGRIFDENKSKETKKKDKGKKDK